MHIEVEILKTKSKKKAWVKWKVFTKDVPHSNFVKMLRSLLFVPTFFWSKLFLLDN